MKRKLGSVTLLGIDCVDINRLIQAAEICLKDFEFADVKLLTSLQSDNKYTVPIKPLNSVEEYSEFVITDLDKYVDTPHVLIIQYDGFILNPEAWDDKFLNYDYIGAPWMVANWAVENFDYPKAMVGKWLVGNGGFSLRTKKLTSLCAELAKTGEFKKYHPEDASICVYNRDLLESRGIKFAPVNLAKQFSYEAEDNEHDKWDGQFAFHGLRWTDISKWLEKNPGYKIDNSLDKEKRGAINLAIKYLGKEIEVVMDRPLGSKHPKYGYVYEVNYGYIENTKAPDGEELDAYYLGIDEPLERAIGTCIAVAHRRDDDDDKLIVVPNGMEMTDEQIMSIIHFQERYFDTEIVR